VTKVSIVRDKISAIAQNPQSLSRLLRRLYLQLVTSPFRQDSTEDPYYQLFQTFLAMVRDRPQPNVLELGARNVTNNSPRNLFTDAAQYVGFDIHAGEGVDVVGDIHQLSTYFPANTFDVVYCISVFEHLAMPWKAILEINRVMKEGGLLFISTHPTFPKHELPWDFWRFSEAAFGVLLNPVTGFEQIACVEGLPCSIVPLVRDRWMKGMSVEPANLGVAVLAQKIANSDSRLCWDVTTAEVTTGMYPT